MKSLVTTNQQLENALDNISRKQEDEIRAYEDRFKQANSELKEIQTNQKEVLWENQLKYNQLNKKYKLEQETHKRELH